MDDYIETNLGNCAEDSGCQTLKEKWGMKFSFMSAEMIRMRKMNQWPSAHIDNPAAIDSSSQVLSFKCTCVN